MAILFGTQSNGETLPVLVDQFGNLLAKGIEGPPGPPGPPGVGELPPGATDGALLGWQDGELVWVTEPLPPVVVPGFRPVIYTGNGNTQSIDCGFSPDLVWLKSRDTGYGHRIFDTVRGATYALSSASAGMQNIQDSALTAFESSGFAIGTEGGVNADGQNFVAWCWGGGDETSTNNDGTIETQVRSNGDFSVISYVGTGDAVTLGHGLSGVPKFIITKNRSREVQWLVYHYETGIGKAAALNYFGEFGNTTLNGNSPPTELTFSTGGGQYENSFSGDEYVSYAWKETPGVASFHKYTGSSGQQTITTGFRPSLLIIKSVGDGDWFMFDNARGAKYALRANLDEKEDETNSIELLDDGFQLLSGGSDVNQSSQTYIYAAFANPEDAAFAQRQLRREAREQEEATKRDPAET